MTFTHNWQTYVLSVVMCFAMGLVVYSIQKLYRLRALQETNLQVTWLIIIAYVLILVSLYFLYVLVAHSFEPIHFFIAIASLLTAVFVWLAINTGYAIAIDLSKSTVVEHYHATHDDLTGLPNLSFFNDQLELILNDSNKEGYEVALLLINLNRFKLINETLGYFVGDVILQKIAQRIRSSLRKTDLIARLGGDEFAVLINPMVAQWHIHTISKNIADFVQEPLAVEGKPTDVGVSIGVAIFPRHASSGLELIEKARASMLEAEKQGNAVLLYDPETSVGNTEDIQIIGMLQRAIQEEQLTVLYQPQVRLHDLKLVSVEALIRWQHPLHGTLDPRHFIPYAERAGLIYEITLWLLQNVVQLLRRWREKDIHLPIAINTTANGLIHKGFQQELNTLLKNDAWLAKMIKIELTETSTIDNANKVIATMKHYKKLGVVFSLDDYGTRHASLEYLKKLPLDELKIDQSFMANAHTDEYSKAIVIHAREIARQLGLTTTAEGIESQEVLALAQECKLDYGQGYYFSPAVTAKDLESHIQKHGFNAAMYIQDAKKLDQPLSKISK